MRPSLKISYWAEQIGPKAISEFEGIEDFKRTLVAEYTTVVRGRPGDLGGLYDLAIHFVSDLTLADIVTFVASGVAYDVLKEGTKSFILRPFIDAYDKLRTRNKWASIDIEVLTLEFQDSIVTMDSTYDQAIPSQIGEILKRLAEAYPLMVQPTGEAPFEIRIPVLEDTTADSVGRYRAILEVDEMVAKRSASDYYGLWGLWYDYSRQFRIYDVQRKNLIDAEFLSRERYWQLSEERWRKQSRI